MGLCGENRITVLVCMLTKRVGKQSMWLTGTFLLQFGIPWGYMELRAIFAFTFQLVFFLSFLSQFGFCMSVPLPYQVRQLHVLGYKYNRWGNNRRGSVLAPSKCVSACSVSPWWCRLPPGRPPVHGTSQNLTLCTPDCCWRGCSVQPGLGERSPCLTNTSCLKRCPAASQPVGCL